MNSRVLVLLGYFVLVVVMGLFAEKEVPELEMTKSFLDIAISENSDSSRIGISVFNARANNIRISKSYREAESIGDLEVRFVSGLDAFTFEVGRHEVPQGQLVDWLTAGSGIGWSLPKGFFAARYQLPRGCYTMEVKFSNRVAVRAPFDGDPGPVSEAAFARKRVCI